MNSTFFQINQQFDAICNKPNSGFPQLLSDAEGPVFAHLVVKPDKMPKETVTHRTTLRETNISHLEKRKIVDSKVPLKGDMLVPWRVTTCYPVHYFGTATISVMICWSSHLQWKKTPFPSGTSVAPSCARTPHSDISHISLGSGSDRSGEFCWGPGPLEIMGGNMSHFLQVKYIFKIQSWFYCPQKYIKILPSLQVL